MKRLRFTKFYAIICLVLCSTMLYGQSDNTAKNNFNNFEKYIYLSGDLGLGALSGDNNSFRLKPNAHLGIGYQFDNILGAKLNLGYGVLTGSFSNADIAGLNYIESNVNLTISLLDIILGYNPDRRLNVVPHIGFGQIQYRVRVVDANGNTTYKAGFNEAQDNIMGDGLNRRKVVATLPMGLEVNYAINPKWTAFVDFTSTYADTDALDGFISGKNDWFASANLGATYRLSNNIFNTKNEYCNYWFTTLDGGASFIFGDNKFSFDDIKGNVNLGGGINFSNHYRFYAKLGYGIYNAGHGSSFRLKYGDYYEINFNIAADVIGLAFGYDEARRVALYPHIGFGQMQYKATTIYNDGHAVQVGYNSNSASNRKGGGLFGRRVAMTIPMGIEFAYKLNNAYEAYADATATYVDSDLLDAVSSGKSRDRHVYFNFGLRYKFNSSCFKTEEEIIAEEENNSCITPEEIKEAIQNAMEEQEADRAEAVRTAVEAAVENMVEDTVVYHKNFANIVFPINKSEKLGSQTNIDALNRASKEMKDGFAVNKIIVEGYASPDGNKELNDRLAQERAEEVKAFVQKTLGTNVEIEINSKGADWDGLIKAIECSDIENKDEIANMIRTSSDREQTLRKLMAEYPQIKELLPQLRRAGVTITTVK